MPGRMPRKPVEKRSTRPLGDPFDRTTNFRVKKETPHPSKISLSGPGYPKRLDLLIRPDFSAADILDYMGVVSEDLSALPAITTPARRAILDKLV
jgi:hypothetical protein